jgi:hypothetical protein
MAHAFVWHELDYNNGNITDSTVQLPYVDMGTIRQGSWNKKLFRLKWINSSVDNVKLWVDSFIADVGVLPDGLSQQGPEDLVKRYGFKYKYLLLNQYETKNLPDCIASTFSPLDRDPDTSELRILGSIGSYTPSLNDIVLLKNQQGVGTTEDNGVYKVYKQKSTSFLGLNLTNTVLRTGYGVSANTGSGTTYYLAYSPTLPPLSTVSYTVDNVKWVARNTSDFLDDVKYATSINHSTVGSGSGKTVLLTSSQYLGSTLSTNVNVNDRILVKEQTNHTENGVYIVTTKYASGQNSFSDPRNSTSSLDSFWTSSTGVTSLIKSGTTFDIAVLNGTVYGGRNFRAYSSLATPNEKDLNWSETTYHNTFTSVTGYLEISDDSTLTVAVATTTVLPNTPTWSAASNTLTASGAATTLVVDGINITSTSTKILVKNQGGGSGASNGIYALSTIGGTATTWALTRTSDLNQSYSTIDFSPVYVSSGTVNAQSTWYLNTQGPITLNTTELTWESRSFDYTSGGAATIYGLPLTISATGGTTYTLQTSDTLLIKDLTTRYVNGILVSDSYINGIYTVSSVGSTAVVNRTSPYNSGAGISALAIKTTLNQNINGGQYFYMNKADQTSQNFTLNLSGIAISDTNIKYRYSPVANIILSNIASGYGVTFISEKITAKGIVSLNDRILITSQSDAYMNGIWEATSGPTVITGLGFTDTYTIQNGGLIYVTGGTAGSATTYMLFSSATNGSTPGNNAVKFFSYNAAYSGSGFTTASAITTVDKLSTNYISPDDFSSAVGNSDRVVVNINSANSNKNGIYTASLGNTLTYAWNFHSSFSQWWLNVSKTDSYGIEVDFIGQDRSLYYVNNFETSTKGNIYIPQAIASKKSAVTYDDTQLENYQINWIEQDYQKYFVRAALGCTTTPPSTAATGSTLFKVFSASGSSSLFDGDNILVICNDLYPTNVSADFGSTTNFASPNNGIYKARVSAGGTVYFEKHADWFYSSSFATASKDLASPYERPTIVRSTDGFIAGFGESIALSKSTFYMQGALKTRVSSNTTGDEGSENFILGSNIYISYDYDNLHLFPKVAPIQHILDYNTLWPAANNIVFDKNDLVYGVSLKFNTTSQIFTYLSGTGYSVMKGDRVLFDLKNSSYSLFNSASPYEVSGIYNCVAYNGTNSGSGGAPSYIFRKVPYEKKYGHIDYYKDLTNNGTGSSVGSTITFSLQTTKDSNFTWHPSTYSYSSIYYSNGGENFLLFSGTSSLGATSGTLRVSVGSGITAGSSIQVRLKQIETPTSDLINYNFISEQILSDRVNVGTGLSRNNTNLSSYDVDARYWQQKNSNTGTVLTAFNQYIAPGTAGTTTLGKTTVDFIVNSSSIYSGTGNSYLYVKRLYSDSSYGGGATTGGTFYPINYFTSNTDFYVGGWSVESNTSSQWYTTYTPIGSTSLIQDVEVAFAGGGGTEKTILVLQPTKSGNLTAEQQSFYYKITTPTYRTKYGRNDQYVLQFKGANKRAITLAYDTSFPSTLAPKRVRVGSGSTYFLNYDPDSTSRANDSRYWIKDSSITTFSSAAVASTTNIDLDNENTIINGVSLSAGSIVLLKNQTDNEQNGIYVNSNINYWNMTRAADMNSVAELVPFGLVNVTNYGDYELQLPNDKPYTLWTFGGAGGTDLIFKYYSENPSVYASVASTTNYSLSSTSIPDIIDGYSPLDQDKVLLLAQTSSQAGVGFTEKVLARYNKTFQASLSRVAAGTTSGEFSLRSLRVNQYAGSGSSVAYETYFDPDSTTVGVGTVNFIPVTSIFNYAQVDFVSNSNVDLTSDLNGQLANFDPTPTSLNPGKTILLKDQTLETENLSYTSASTNIMLLKRDSSLSSTSNIVSNLRVKVTTYDEGASKSGSYGIWYSGAPTLDSDPLYFLKQYSSIKLVDCACATTASINLTSPPTTIDDYELDTNDRILVKNQSTSSQNGVYYLFNKQSNQWKRSSDLNSSYQVVPHLNVYISNGSTNSGRIYVINLTDIPRKITDTNLYPYIIDTDPIGWTNYNFGELFNSNPANWKDLPDTRDGAADLQSAKINEFGFAESSDIALAIYVPNVTGKLASSNGQVRNQKINVEYDIAKD